MSGEHVITQTGSVPTDVQIDVALDRTRSVQQEVAAQLATSGVPEPGTTREAVSRATDLEALISGEDDDPGDDDDENEDDQADL